MFTEEDINKLPKWAQQRIKSLMSNVEHWQKKAKEVSGEGETNVFISYHPNNQPLPKNSKIIFKLNEGEINIVPNNGTLDVTAYYTEKRLAICPRVSNGFSINLV